MPLPFIKFSESVVLAARARAQQCPGTRYSSHSARRFEHFSQRFRKRVWLWYRQASVVHCQRAVFVNTCLQVDGPKSSSHTSLAQPASLDTVAAFIMRCCSAFLPQNTAMVKSEGWSKLPIYVGRQGRAAVKRIRVAVKGMYGMASRAGMCKVAVYYASRMQKFL